VYYTSKTISSLSTYQEVGIWEGYDLLNTSKSASVKILADRVQHELVLLWIIYHQR